MSIILFLLGVIGAIILTFIISTTISYQDAEIIEVNEAPVASFEDLIEKRREERAFDALSVDDQIKYIEEKNLEYEGYLKKIRMERQNKKKESPYAIVRFFPWLIKKIHEVIDEIEIVIV